MSAASLTEEAGRPRQADGSSGNRFADPSDKEACGITFRDGRPIFITECVRPIGFRQTAPLDLTAPADVRFRRSSERHFNAGTQFMLDQWNNFFVMVGGGAAALAGLIFVAMSINPENIIKNATHKNRAINMLTGFSAIYIASGFALMGSQHPEALGIEWLLLWTVATIWFIRGYVVAIRAGMSSIGLTLPRLAGGTICYFAEVAGAVFLIAGRTIGLYIAAVGIIVLFAFLISGAWLLIIGVYERPD